MRRLRCQFRGFSLVEVILAVGIFATAIAVLLALLAPLSRQAAASADTLAALRLSGAIRTELQRLAVAGGLDNLAAQARPMTVAWPPTLTLVATRDAARVRSLSYLPPPAADQVPEAGRFFAIEAWTFNQAPLAFDPGGPALALHVRVSWPYFLPSATAATPLADREQVTYNLPLSR
jgi:type II secretory pathway pseudopilin PulG